MAQQPVRCAASVVALACLCACDGIIGDPGDEPSPADVGPLGLRALTRLEYINTTRDLLGVEVDSIVRFPSEIVGDSGFATVGQISDVNVKRYMDAAEALAAAAMARPEFVPCEPITGEACARALITSLGPRAYRRPLGDADVEDYLALYRTGRGELALDERGALALVVAAMLQSPFFLYHWEFDRGVAPPARADGVIALDSHYLASRLSYFLWRTMPDAALADAAAADRLRDPAVLEAEARRLLADPRARPVLDDFFHQLLGIDKVLTQPKSASLYPEVTDDVRRAMLAEVDAFTRDIVFDGDGSLRTLLTAHHGFANRHTAPLYGAASVTGDELTRVELDASERAGLLTLPAVLTATADAIEGNPIFRGVLLRERILCEELPPPPGDIPPLPPPMGGATVRARVEGHTAPALCQSCHQHINSLGFAFGHYDAIGRFQVAENELPIDATGELTLIADPGVRAPFDGARAFAELLTTRGEVYDCFARQLLRYAYGRHERPTDAASRAMVLERFSASDWNLRELMVAMVGSRSFRAATLEEAP